MSVQTPSVFAYGESTSLVNEGGKGSYAKFQFTVAKSREMPGSFCFIYREAMYFLISGTE